MCAIRPDKTINEIVCALISFHILLITLIYAQSKKIADGLISSNKHLFMKVRVLSVIKSQRQDFIFP